MRCIKILVPTGILIAVAAIVVPLVLVFGNWQQETQDAPLVNTTVGMIRGLRDADGTAMFLGIPYAIVDQSNPFGAAIVNPTFETIFNAFHDSARCPQRHGIEQTTLDCLHLNIHVPNTATTDPLPVLVYIHGGGFFNGSAGRESIDPKFLVQRDVIFVSINYRLAVYGFLCLHIPEAPGNQGLKDQLDALRWIKNNIKAFGGDDENITITGDSAGATAVHLHVLFAEAGLFNKAITQSGTAFSPWFFHEPNLETAIKIADHLGFQTNDSSAAVAFLANQTSTDVMDAANILDIVSGPCVEQEFPNVERYAPTHPVNTSSINASNITLLAGYNSDEWLMMYANMPDEGFDNFANFNFNLFLGFNFGELQNTMKLFVRRFYIGDEPMSVKHRRAAIDSDSDFVVNHPTQRAIKHHLDHGGTVYHYVFSYVGARNQQVDFKDRGAAHLDELRYLYDMPGLPETITPADQLIIDRITTLWANFAKYGNPTPSITPLLPVQWPPATQDRLVFMNIDTTMSVSTRPFHRRLSFWDFFYESNRQYVRGYGG